MSCRQPASQSGTSYAGEGVSEMCIHVGAGYRVYFIQEGARIYLMLGDGDKSTQRRDIAAVKDMARQRREES